MYQNKSTAVMQQRYESKDSLDDFPTPPWATKALCEFVLPKIWTGISLSSKKENLVALFTKNKLSKMSVWEPSCNRGYMVRPLKKYFGKVYESDIVDYNNEQKLSGYDYVNQEWVNKELKDEERPYYFNDKEFPPSPDAIITNPPFRLAEEFILKSLSLSSVNLAAFFVRLSFLEEKGRWNNLFSKYPPTVVCPFVERVPLVKGKYDPKVSSATSYAWFVWVRGISRPSQVIWIPPCRKNLELESDY